MYKKNSRNCFNWLIGINVEENRLKWNMKFALVVMEPVNDALDKKGLNVGRVWGQVKKRFHPSKRRILRPLCLGDEVIDNNCLRQYKSHP